MNLEEKLVETKMRQQQLVAEANGLDERKQGVINEVLRLEGRIQLLNEQIEEQKKKEDKHAKQ